MAKLTTAEFIEAIKELTVLELNDLVKACEEEFGVSAAAGVVVAAAGAGAEAAEEKDEFDLRQNWKQKALKLLLNNLSKQSNAIYKNHSMETCCGFFMLFYGKIW